MEQRSLLTPEIKEDPYPIYRELRRDAPVCLVEPGYWMVTRYDDVFYILRNPALFSSSGESIATNVVGHDPDPLAGSMIVTDPPEHTRLRRIANRTFNQRAIDRLGPRVNEITDELIGRIAGRGESDLVADVAVPLPLRVIAELLGIEAERHKDFKFWSDEIVNGFKWTLSEEESTRIRASVTEFRAFMRAKVADRRAEKKEDLISALVHCEDEQSSLTDDEIVSTLVLLLAAGNETTTNLIGNAIFYLLENPDQMKMVLADPGLVPNVVEETVRYAQPVQNLFRQATQDVELSGITIPKGAVVMACSGSANRDETVFPDPDRFDITRDNQRSLGFGLGIHLCLGAPLARIEGRVALNAVLTRLPNLSLEKDVPLKWQEPSFVVRGLEELWVTFDPSGT